MLILKSGLLFGLAGFAEIGGGYLMWLWLRRNETFLLGVLGGVVLAFYGIVPTFQHTNFGRVYAAYGGVFVVMSLLWGWLIDKHRPDLHDWLGAAIIPFGVGIIMYWPRSGAS